MTPLLQAEEALVYRYTDDFSQDLASQDCLFHSLFWVKGAYPPPEPHLVYWSYGPGQRAILLRDHQGRPARLGYCIPVEPDKVVGFQPLKVVARVDVQLLTSPNPNGGTIGYLLYMTSADGKTWSVPEAIDPGRSELALGSPQQVRFLVFVGANAAIDELAIELYRKEPDLVVPTDAPTIQQAIDMARDGQVILVRDGRYTGPGNYDVRFRGKKVRLVSENGPQACLIDCQSSGRAFIFDGHETSQTVVDGFAIVNGAARTGGGILCTNSSPTISNCHIKDCWAIGATDQGLGGGIYAEAGSPRIADCLIVQNWTESTGLGIGGSGGGIFLKGDCGATIERCTFAANGAMAGELTQNRGGAICCEGNGQNQGRTVTISNCLFYDNSAGDAGGAVAANGVRLEIVNCTITDNAADVSGGGIYLASTGQDSRPTCVIKNSILWGNRPGQISNVAQSLLEVIYCDVQGGWPGKGNLDADPLFARPFDQAQGDAHLVSFAGRYDPDYGSWVHDPYTSPCVDAGDPEDQVGPEPVPNGNRVDIGVYGATPQASKGAGPLVFHVATRGDDENPGLDPSRPLATIQRAIDLSRDGDAILVWPGVYAEEVDFKSKAVLVQSAADAAVVTASGGAYAFSFYHQEGRSSVLRNLVIRDCTEGGVFCHGAAPTLANLTIVNCGVGVAAFEGAEPLITNCIIWYNTKADLLNCQATYSCLQRPQQAAGQGNIVRQPLFADLLGGDVHLCSRYGRYWPQHDVWVVDQQTSPCIDAGDPTVYPPEEPAYNGNRIDMGAHGGTAYASRSCPGLVGDLNQDGIVDLRDLALLAEHWLAVGR